MRFWRLENPWPGVIPVRRNDRNREVAFDITTASLSPSSVLHLPSLKHIAHHALPTLVESSIGPAVLFYVMLTLVGFRGALIAALAWSYAAAGRRIVCRQRIPALLALGLGLLTARSIIAFFTKSAFLYFAQPTAGTIFVALLFFGTAIAGRPLVERLAHDFCPFDEELTSQPVVRQFFLRVSYLWAVVLLVNSGFVLWLLIASSLHAFVIERTLVTWVLMGGGIVVSTVWFVRTMRNGGITVKFGAAHTPEVAVAVEAPG
jgi:uncharacterized membrane protein